MLANTIKIGLKKSNVRLRGIWPHIPGNLHSKPISKRTDTHQANEFREDEIKNIVKTIPTFNWPRKCKWTTVKWTKKDFIGNLFTWGNLFSK